MMTQLEIPSFLSKPLHIEFTQKDTTSDSGLIFAQQIVKKFDLAERISSAIPDPRDPSRILHEQEDLINQRLLQMIAGYEDVNDSDALRKDPGMAKLILDEKTKSTKKPEDKQNFLGSSPTMNRLENRFNRKGIESLVRLQIDLYLERNKKRFQSELKSGNNLVIQLDLDPTDLETHGQQQFAFYNGHYEHTAYLPLLIVDGENGDLIASIPRPGNRHACWLLRLILSGIFNQILKVYPQVEFKIRADSGFQSEPFFRFLETHPAVEGAAISLMGNRRLNRLSQEAVSDYKKALESRENKQESLIHFGEFGYRADSWSCFRRVVYQIQEAHYGKTEIRYYMTFDQISNPQAIKEDYNQRADAENRIKEFKLQAFATRVSGETFLVNAFRMLMSGMVLIIYQEIRKKLKDTSFAKACVQTIREKLIKVAGVLKESTRRLHLILPQSYPYSEIWRTLIYAT
jgi:hypothetical protein